MKKIIWLASYPKSGNTWLRILLSNLITYSRIPLSINELAINNIASSREEFDEHTGLESSELTNDEIQDLRPSVYIEMSKSTAKDFLFIKVHDSLKFTPKGRLLFPIEATKCVFYIIRHPLDVAVSNAIHNSISFRQSYNNLMNPTYSIAGRTNGIGSQIRQNLSSWLKHVDSWTNQSFLPTYVIKYEDLLEDSFTTLNNALRYAGLNYSDQEINHAIKNSTFTQLQSQESSKGFKEKPMNSHSFFRYGNAGSWKNVFSKSDLDDFAEPKHEILTKFGYL